MIGIQLDACRRRRQILLSYLVVEEVVAVVVVAVLMVVMIDLTRAHFGSLSIGRTFSPISAGNGANAATAAVALQIVQPGKSKGVGAFSASKTLGKLITLQR